MLGPGVRPEKAGTILLSTMNNAMDSWMQTIPWWVWPLAVWDAAWKMAGCWKAARNGHLAWFIGLALLNTVGILPVIYILTHRSEPVSKPGDRHGHAPGPAPEN